LGRCRELLNVLDQRWSREVGPSLCGIEVIAKGQTRHLLFFGKL
jgi:hypothetical protein